MTAFLRLLLGIALLPACWGITRSFVDALFVATGLEGGFSVESVALVAGMALFALSWTALPRPVRTYVLAHELTHALWALAFGAAPSDVRVSEHGGSVRLQRTNMLITLAPYFFPFYTFVVILAALVTYAFLRPLPYLPVWMFAIGFTWAFHVLFTLDTLTVRQPDITLYGRIFSWTFIYLANVAIVLVWLAATTPLEFQQLSSILASRMTSSYLLVANGALWLYNKTRSLICSMD